MINAGTTFFIVSLSLALTVNVSAMPTEALTVAEVLQDHALFNRKQVEVQGKVNKVKQGRSRMAVEATFFDLVDENSAAHIQVVCPPGKTIVQESSVVTVRGEYYEKSSDVGIYYGKDAGTKSGIDVIEATQIVFEPSP